MAKNITFFIVKFYLLIIVNKWDSQFEIKLKYNM